MSKLETENGPPAKNRRLEVSALHVDASKKLLISSSLCNSMCLTLAADFFLGAAFLVGVFLVAVFFCSSRQ